MIHTNRCGCIVEKTNETIGKEGGVRESTGLPYKVVKFKKCKKCHDYETKRNKLIQTASAIADDSVPEIRTSRASTREREIASSKWNLIFHTTMNRLCQT